MHSKTFLITGGNFTNKGAQSMLIITVSEIRKRFPDSDVWVLPVDDYKLYDQKNLKFKVMRNHQDLFLTKPGILNKLYLIAKNAARFVLRKDYVFSDLLKYQKVITNTDCIIDISGFCLSSQFSIEYNMMLINTIGEGTKYNIPVLVMPQSFGPFEYDTKKEEMIKFIGDSLQYPYAVFAREREGYEYVKRICPSSNLILSSDLVLQNKGVNLKDVFKEVPRISEIEIVGEKRVALIPNSMNKTQGRQNEILLLYRLIVNELLKRKKEVYILYHSSTDKKYCEEIIEGINDSHLHFTDQDFNCYEYDQIVKNFDYIIASRYHSIVHAYRNKVPCLILGWATKYKELASLFNQDDLVIDTRKNMLDKDLILKLDDLDCNYLEYQKALSRKLPDIQKDNCFNILNDLFEVRG